MLLNGAIGKFAQIRENKEYEWDTIENDIPRRNSGWQPVEIYGIHRLNKQNKTTKLKNTNIPQ